MGLNIKGIKIVMAAKAIVLFRTDIKSAKAATLSQGHSGKLA